MVREGRESCLAKVGRDWRRSRRSVIWIEEFDRLIAGARQELLILRPAHSFDDAVVGLGVPDFTSTDQVPHLYHSITTSAGKSLQRPGILCHCVDAIDVAISQLSYEGLREHALELRGIESSCIFSCSFEGMDGGIEIAGLSRYT